MTCVPSYNACVVANNDWYLDVQLKIDENTDLDLTGATAEMQLIDNILDVPEVLDVTTDIYSPTEGKIRLSLTAAETAGLVVIGVDSSRNLEGDLRVDFPGSSEVDQKTYFTLLLEVHQTRNRPS